RFSRNGGGYLCSERDTALPRLSGEFYDKQRRQRVRFALFDFQEIALENLRTKLNAAHSLASSDSPQAVSFSAPTGSGKTVVMTALFEDIFFGNLDFPSQPNAAILWISDMPELNEQSRLKMESASNKIRTGQLIQIDANFD